MVNLEGRAQRLRRAVMPPCPDELAWIARLAERFGVTIAPEARGVFAELSPKLFDGASLAEVGERAVLRAAVESREVPVPQPKRASRAKAASGGPLRLTSYRALFSGPAVERVPELRFQRPEHVVELSPKDASVRGVENGDVVRVSSNGTSVDLRARVNRRLLAGVVRAAAEHVEGLRGRRRGDEAVILAEVWWIGLIEALVIINLVLLAFAYTTLVERKLLGRMQLRFGPNRAGPFGLLQPIADLVKLVRKEAFFPGKVEALPYIVAPAFSAFAALLVFSVIPFGEGWEVSGYEINGVVANVPIGLILFFAIGSVGVYGFIVGGWASDSKFSLLGSMRTCAQLVSYEVSLSLSVLGVVLLGQSLNLSDIVNKQIDSMWYVGPQFVGFVVFFLAAVAETARAPFDLPEADSELVAGYHTEYSGMRWGLFQMAEYVNMIALSALGITLFFGGWEGPWAPLGPLWFVIKLVIAIALFIWIRATVPRLRYDQLMRFGWKILLPVATLNALITALVVAWTS